MKNLKFPVIVFFAAMLVYACESSEEENMCTHAHFIFVNEFGEDLFNPATDGFIDTSQFSVWSPENQKPHYVFYTNDTTSFVFAFGFDGYPGKDGIVYLKFGDFNVDTIYAKYAETDHATFISELYYNDSTLAINERWRSACDNIYTITVTPDARE